MNLPELNDKIKGKFFTYETKDCSIYGRIDFAYNLACGEIWLQCSKLIHALPNRTIQEFNNRALSYIHVKDKIKIFDLEKTDISEIPDWILLHFLGEQNLTS